MPLYDYRCAQCGAVTEVRHGFDQTHDSPCAACGGELKRVFNPAPIVFKGSGFYITDSRKSGSGGGASTKTDVPKAESGASGGEKSGGSGPSSSSGSTSSDASSSPGATGSADSSGAKPPSKESAA